MFAPITFENPYGLVVPGLGEYLQNGNEADFKKARKHLEKLANPRKTPKPANDYRNQANLLLGMLWKEAADKGHHALSQSELCEPQLMAIKHFQQIHLGTVPDSPDVWMLTAARREIADFYAKAAFPKRRAEIETPGLLKADHLRTLVADIEIVQVHSHCFGLFVNMPHNYFAMDFEKRRAEIEPYIDTHHLAAKHLVFRDNGLNHAQQYKILRACFDRGLITADNFALNLMRIHAAIKDSHSPEDEKLRRNVKYYLTDTLLTQYYDPNTSVDKKSQCANNLTQLYNDLHEHHKQHLFNQAIFVGNRKALDAKQMLNRLKWTGHQHIPITTPGAHIAEVTRPFTTVGKAAFSIPLIIVGSVLDIVTIIPLFLKACTFIFEGCCGRENNYGRGGWGQDINNLWTDTCFTFMFKQIGKAIGFVVGGVIGLVTSLLTYLPRIIFQGVRNLGRNAQAPNGHASIQEITDALGTKPITFKHKKPALDYLRKGKEFSNYKNTDHHFVAANAAEAEDEAATKYQQRFKLFQPAQVHEDNAPTAPPAPQLDYEMYANQAGESLNLYPDVGPYGAPPIPSH